MLKPIFHVEKDLIADLNIENLRTKAWDLEWTLRKHYSKHGQVYSFKTAEDVFRVYELSGIGLTFRSLENLDEDLRNRNESITNEANYNVLRKLCNGFTKNVLKNMSNVGNLQDAFILVGGLGSPEEASFKVDRSFYLRPPNVLNFLYGHNCSSGPMELYFKYNVPSFSEEIFQEVECKYDPVNKVLIFNDLGYYRLKEKDFRLMNPQPSTERRVNNETPLVKILESYQK